MKQESAETIGLQILAWLAGNDELLPVFLGSTGASVEDVRSRAEDTDFIISILDFILMNEEWVTAFCDQVGLPYDAPMRARAALPGGETVHWT